jgi:hypothetical protein
MEPICGSYFEVNSIELGSQSIQLQRRNFGANNCRVSIGAISAYNFITGLSLLLPCNIILFLHLLSTNHNCT